VILVGVPFSSTQTGRSVGYGPVAIREGIKNLIGWDPELGVNIFEKLKFSDIGDVEVIPGNWSLTKNALVDTLNEILLQNPQVLPAVVGGEHLITLGVLESLSSHTKGKITVVHFDAHRDLKEDWLGERYSHTTWAKRALEKNDVNLVQIGCRIWDPDEMVVFRKYKVKDTLSDIKGPVYLTVDLDVFDPAFAPDVGTPQPGGLTPQDFFPFLKKLPFRNLVGFDIVECAADRFNSRTGLLAAELFKKILGYWSKYGKG